MWDKARKENGSFNIVYLIIAGVLAIVVILLYVYLGPSDNRPPASSQVEALDNTASEDELLYINNVYTISSTCIDALDSLSNLFLIYQPLDGDWLSAAHAEILLIQWSVEDARGLVPPASMSHIHNVFLDGMEKYDDAMTLLAGNINNLSQANIDSIELKFTEGAEYFSEAADLLAIFKAQHGIN